jgi:hypothetical protein
MNFDYVSENMFQGKQFLLDVFRFGGVMEIFKGHPVSSFFL